MTTSARSLVAISVLLGVIALPAAAGPSSAASSASDSVAASVGSLSGSVGTSSNSSSGNPRVAAGDYRLIEVAADAGRPELVRLTLAPTQAIGGRDASFVLTLPREVLARTALAEGATVSVAERPYGLEFAHGRPRLAFYLALHDDWYRELRTTPVVL